MSPRWDVSQDGPLCDVVARVLYITVGGVFGMGDVGMRCGIRADVGTVGVIAQNAKISHFY